MKKIRLKKAWSSSPKLHFDAGAVVGVHDDIAAVMVAKGCAEYVADDVRQLRYPADKSVQSECFESVELYEDQAPKKATLKQPELSTDKKNKTWLL